MSVDATPGIGAYLREARERAGLSVHAISDRTKIPVATLEALERDEVSRLPGGIFLRSFVRAYAAEVGLDPEQAVRRFVARYPDAYVEETPSAFLPNPEKIVVDGEPAAGRLWRVVGWSLPLVLVIVYFGFGGRLSWLHQSAPPVAPHVEAQAEPSSGTPAPVLTTPAAPPQPAPAPTGGTGEPATATMPTAGATADQPPRAAEALQPAEAASPAPAAGQFQLTLASRGRCWVTIRSDGKIIYTGTMNAGERQELTVGGQVSLTVGNAGVIDLALNGKTARSLGGEGQVATARLSADNLNTFLVSR